MVRSDRQKWSSKLVAWSDRQKWSPEVIAKKWSGYSSARGPVSCRSQILKIPKITIFQVSSLVKFANVCGWKDGRQTAVTPSWLPEFDLCRQEVLPVFRARSCKFLVVQLVVSPNSSRQFRQFSSTFLPLSGRVQRFEKLESSKYLNWPKFKVFQFATISTFTFLNYLLLALPSRFLPILRLKCHSLQVNCERVQWIKVWTFSWTRSTHQTTKRWSPKEYHQPSAACEGPSSRQTEGSRRRSTAVIRTSATHIGTHTYVSRSFLRNP